MHTEVPVALAKKGEVTPGAAGVCAPWAALKGINGEYIGNIFKIIGRRNMFLDFSLYGSWEALDKCKSMPQGPLSFSTPGKPISENFIF